MQNFERMTSETLPSLGFEVASAREQAPGALSSTQIGEKKAVTGPYVTPKTQSETDSQGTIQTAIQMMIEKGLNALDISLPTAGGSAQAQFKLYKAEGTPDNGETVIGKKDGKPAYFLFESKREGASGGFGMVTDTWLVNEKTDYRALGQAKYVVKYQAAKEPVPGTYQRELFFHQQLERETFSDVTGIYGLDVANPRRVYSFNTKQSNFFFMPKAPGKDAFEQHSELWNTQGPSFNQRLEAVNLMLLNWIVFINGNGLIHLDIKPENIMINFSKTLSVNLIDFGASLTTEEAKAGKVGVRTARFAAPELCFKAGLGSEMSDVFSLGLVITLLFGGYFNRYQALYGKNCPPNWPVGFENIFCNRDLPSRMPLLRSTESINILDEGFVYYATILMLSRAVNENLRERPTGIELFQYFGVLRRYFATLEKVKVAQRPEELKELKAEQFSTLRTLLSLAGDEPKEGVNNNSGILCRTEFISINCQLFKRDTYSSSRQEPAQETKPSALHLAMQTVPPVLDRTVLDDYDRGFEELHALVRTGVSDYSSFSGTVFSVARPALNQTASGDYDKVCKTSPVLRSRL